MSTIDTIIQGGAVGLSVMIGSILYYVLKNYFKIVSNHINHNTEALNKVSKSLDKNIEVANKTYKVMDRIERVLDKN